MKNWRRTIAVISAFALLFNSLSAPLIVLAEESSTPTPTSLPTDTPAPTESPTPTETATPTPAETPTIEPSSTPTATPDASPTETATPTPTPEKVCLTDEEIKDTTNENWNINEIEGYAETKENVRLGIHYVFPQENKVSVTFKCLPKDESSRTPIKIQKVKVSDLKLPEGTNPYGEYAYDITTGMTDGTFEYDVTLPKSPDANSEVSYIEKTIDQAKQEVKSEDLHEIDSSKIVQNGDTVKATSIDHFSIYISTYASNLTTNKTIYEQGEIIYAKNYVNVSNNSRIYYRIDILNPSNTIVSSSGCHNYTNNLSHSYQTTQADPIGSGWKAVMTMYGKSGYGAFDGESDCTNRSNIQDTGTANFQLTASSNVVNPTLSQSCGLDVVLVLDNSTSVGSNLGTMKTAFKSFVDTLSATPTQFSVVYFNNTAYVQSSFSSDISTIKTAIDSVPTATGYTNWQDGLLKAKLMADPRPSVPNLILFSSDGDPNRYYSDISDENNPTGLVDGGMNFDTASHNAAISMANTIKNLGTRIVTLGIGTGSNMQSRMVAISSSDAYYNASNFGSLSTTLTAIVTNLCGGSISVNKYIDSISDSTRGGTGWNFSVASPSSSINLSSDSSGQANTGKVTAGTYSVTETNMLPGYSYGSASCKNTQTGVSVGSDITNGVGSIPIANTDVISCDFINTTNPTTGTVEIKKYTTPLSGDGTFNFTVGGDNPSTQSITTSSNYGTSGAITVSAGDYSVSETVPTGWYINSSYCQKNGSGTVPASGFTVDPNDSVICYFTDAKLGSINVTKVADPGNTGDEFNILLNLNGGLLSSKVVENGEIANFTGLQPGNYSLSEVYPAGNETKGWYLDHAVCDGTRYDPGSTITLQPAENINCTFYNIKSGKIIVDKVTNPSGSSKSFDFDLDILGTPTYNYDSFSLTDAGTPYSSLLNPGHYSVSETVPTGWYQSSAVCNDGSSVSDIDLGPGETITCTFTNTQLASISGYKYDDINGSLTSSGDRIPVVGWAIELWQNGAKILETTTNSNGYYFFGNLLPGNYRIIEQLLAGWTNLLADTININLVAGQDSQNNNFVNTRYGKIIVEKQTNPDGSTERFEFDPSWSTSNFYLSDNQSTNSGDLVPANYSVVEVGNPNWTLSDVDCSDGSDPASISLQSGEVVTCVFTNTRNTGTLRVVKTLINDNWGTAKNEDFSFVVNNDGTNRYFESDGSNDYIVPTGTYSVVENPTSDYLTTYSNCNNAIVTTGNITTCTITNNDIAPSLTLNKVVVNDNGGTQPESAWTLTANGGPRGTLSGRGAPGSTDVVSGPMFKIGTYTLSESGPSGYAASSWTCTNGVVVNPGNQITLGLGQSTVCSITNNDVQPKLTVTKIVSGGSAQVSDFSLYVGSAQVTSGVQNGFNVGNYRVSESGLKMQQYTGTFSGDCNSSGFVTLNLGDVKNCTITNTRDTARLRVVKNVDLNGDGDYSDPGELNATDWQWNASWLGLPEYSHTGNTGDPSITLYTSLYNITETPKEGFHQVSFSCNVPVGENQTVSVSKGFSVVCVFTNARDLGSLTIHKIIDADGDLATTNDQTSGDNWQFDVDGTSIDTSDPSADYTNVDGIKVFSNLKTGQYTVNETIQPGYDLIGATCGSGSFDNVDSVDGVIVSTNTSTSCTFYNSPNGTIHGYKWSDADDSGTLNNSEDLLSGWTVNLYKWNGDDFDSTPVRSMITSDGVEHFGWYWFEHLFPGTYKVCEVAQSGWQQTFPINSDNNCHVISLPSGNSNGFDLPAQANAVGGPVYSFGNQEFAEVTVYKFNDLDQDGTHDDDEPYLSDWEMTMAEVGGVSSSQVTGNDGSTIFSLKPASYILSETLKDGWQQSNIYCENSESGVKITTDGEAYGHHGACEGWNECGDAATCAQWACEVNGYSNLVSYGDAKPCTEFQSCNLFHSRGNVQMDWGNGCPVMGVTDIFCSNSSRSLASLDNRDEITLNAGQSKKCYVGNFEEEPKINITKSNNRSGGISAGNSIDYSITLTNDGNVPVSGITIQDVLPGGFSYVSGSTTGATTNDPSINGSVLSWSGFQTLGAGESITINYQAVASSDLADGLYVNFATCNAYTRSEKNVNCDPSANSTVRIGNGVSFGGGLGGQVLGISTVLGASTELPATGSPTAIAIAALGMIGFGLLLNGLMKAKIKSVKKKATRKVVKSAKKKGRKHAKK